MCLISPVFSEVTKEPEDTHQHLHKQPQGGRGPHAVAAQAGNCPWVAPACCLPFSHLPLKGKRRRSHQCGPTCPFLCQRNGDARCPGQTVQWTLQARNCSLPLHTACRSLQTGRRSHQAGVEGTWDVLLLGLAASVEHSGGIAQPCSRLVLPCL